MCVFVFVESRNSTREIRLTAFQQPHDAPQPTRCHDRQTHTRIASEPSSSRFTVSLPFPPPFPLPLFPPLPLPPSPSLSPFPSSVSCPSSPLLLSRPHSLLSPLFQPVSKSLSLPLACNLLITSPFLCPRTLSRSPSIPMCVLMYVCACTHIETTTRQERPQEIREEAEVKEGPKHNAVGRCRLGVYRSWQSS